jgi:dolichol-phosphate mannosyltransferase
MDHTISIVVPVYNSSTFLAKTVEAIDNQRKASNWKLELVLIDDGSRDKSYEKIVELSQQYPYIK